jgi:hypothetical protein
MPMICSSAPVPDQGAAAVAAVRIFLLCPPSCAAGPSPVTVAIQQAAQPPR